MADKKVTVATLFFGFLAVQLAGSVSAANPKEHVLYRFQGGNDGISPMAVMIADKTGNLYGTTALGGGSVNCFSGCGTVFELSPPASVNGSWTETVLYRFQGGDDGANPEAALVADQAGNLYGTTSAGGNGNCIPQQLVGCGTVFELVRPTTAGSAWAKRVLYNFQGVPSGEGNGDLAAPNGLVFGKTAAFTALRTAAGTALRTRSAYRVAEERTG
jgi:hypothetical protein